MLNMYTMLEKIGSSVKSIGSKLLILLIALSFAVWGIGDIFTGNDNPTVASIGKSEIKLKTFNLEYQSIIDSLRRSSDDPISEELIKAMGEKCKISIRNIRRDENGCCLWCAFL